MRQAMVRLAELGHKRIEFANGGTRYNYIWLHEQGFRRGMADTCLNIDPNLMIPDAVTVIADAAAARSLLSVSYDPTVIVFAVDAAALDVWAVAKDKGLSIGQELSIEAYDGSPECAASTPTLSSFAVNIRHAGERLAHLSIRRSRGVDPRNLREIESAEFRSGGSIGPAPSLKT